MAETKETPITQETNAVIYDKSYPIFGKQNRCVKTEFYINDRCVRTVVNCVLFDLVEFTKTERIRTTF
jgi:hypothetical protein